MAIRPDYASAYAEMLKQIEDAKKKKEQAIDLSTAQNVSNLQSQRALVNEQATADNRKAGINYAFANSRLPAQMSRMGIKGTGEAETSQISMNNAYQEKLNEILASKTAAQRGIDTSVTNAQNTGAVNKANVAADTAAQMPSIYQTYLSNQQNQYDSDYKRELAAAELMASAGDYSGYKVLGLTDEQIAKLSPQQTRGTRGTSRTGAGGTKDTDDSDKINKAYISMSGMSPEQMEAYLDKLIAKGALTLAEANKAYERALDNYRG